MVIFSGKRRKMLGKIDLPFLFFLGVKCVMSCFYKENEVHAYFILMPI